jgi:hypothetical protein
MTLREAYKLLLVRGPNAVLVDRQGTLVPTAEFLKRDAGGWDVVFIREDGFAVAADFYHWQYAEVLYPGQWIGRIRRGDKIPTAMTIAVDKGNAPGV